MAISSSFKAKCPSCAGLVLIKDPKLIGKKVECPKCKARFVVEDPAGQDRDAVAADADQTPRPPAKKEAVKAAPPRAAAKPPAKAAPPADEEEDLEEMDAAPRAKPNGKAANGKSTQIKAANGKAPAKSAPADDAKKAKGKAAGKLDRDEEDEDEAEKPKGKKKKAGNKGSQKLLIGGGLAVLGVAGLVVAFFMFMNKKSDTKGDTKGGGQQVAKGQNGVGVQPPQGDPEPDGANPNGNGAGGQNPPQTNVVAEGGQQNTGQPNPNGGNPNANPQGNSGKQGPKDPPRPARGTGTPAGVELTNLLPQSTQGVFQLNVREFLDSPMAAAAFEKGGPFDNEELRRKLGFWVTSLDRLIVAENYADGWALTVLHTLDPIDNLDPLKRALGLQSPKERAIKNQDYYLITRNNHWLANLGRLSLGGPAHIRNAQPKAQQPAAPLYLRLHNRQTLIVSHLQPMRDFLTHEGHFEAQSSPAPAPGRPQNPGRFPPGMVPPGQTPPGAPGPGPGQGQLRPLTPNSGSPGPGAPGGQGQLRPLTPNSGSPGQAPGGQVRPDAPPKTPGGSGQAPNQYGAGSGQFPPGQPRPMPPGMIPPGQAPPGQAPQGDGPPAQKPSSAPTEPYVTISPTLKAMLDKMGKHADEGERVIFLSATDMSAARLSNRGQEDPQRVLWRVRPVWDVTNLLNERKERMTVLGTGLVMKDLTNYSYKSAMHCPNDKDATALRADLGKKVAPDLARVLRLILNGHKIEVVQDEAPPAPAGNPQSPAGNPQFPEGTAPPIFPPGMRPPGQFPPGQGNPGREKAGEKEEPKGSRILVTSEGHDVLFRLELVLDESAQQAMAGAMQVVMMGLRAEIDVADGAARRHDLALAGKRLGEEGLSDRRILPGQYPPGAFPPPPSGKRSARDPGQRVSWMAGLLPYLGHGELYRRIDFNRSWKDPVNWLAARTLVPELIDPTFPRRVRYTPYPGLPLEAASTHYVGLAGIGLDAAEYSAGDPAVVNKLGVFGYDRAASLKEIGEGRGLSNTILLIRTPYDGPAGVTPWMAGGGSTVRTVPDKKSAEPFFSPGPDGTPGTYVLMTDSSVRYVKKGISDEAFKAMVTVRGPSPRDFDIDEVAPKVEAPKKEEEPQGKEDLLPEPPAKGNPAKLPPPPPQGGNPQKGGKEYFPPGGRCSVVLPAGDIQHQSQKVPLPNGQTVTLELYGIGVGQDQSMAIMFADYPAGLIQPGTEDLVLDGAGKGMALKLPGSKITAEKKIKLGTYPGRDLSVEVPGKGELRARTYLVGNRMYILLVGGTKAYANSAEADRFLRSLKLQGGAGQPAPGKGPGQQPQAQLPQGGGAISAVDLVRAYQTNRAAADKQYTGQVITVQGQLEGRKGNSVALRTGLNSILPGAKPGTTDVVEVQFSQAADVALAGQPGANITVQGRCIGFNQIFDVVIVDAKLIGP